MRTQYPSGELFEFARRTPWWVGLLIVPGIYIVCRWLFPWSLRLIVSGDETGILPAVATGFSGVFRGFAPVFALLALSLWAVAQLYKFSDRRRLDAQTGIDSIRMLSWRDFEELLAEAFRRQGYRVELTPNGADGGVDLRVQRDGRTGIVQAKQWRKQKVGVKPVRELFGVAAAEGADDVIFVTSGGYTDAAQQFGQANGMRLIDGKQLARLVHGVQKRSAVATVNEIPEIQSNPPAAPAAVPAVPACPLCSSPMVRRIAKKGPNQGSAFWGCSRFPKCRGTRDLSEA